MTFVVAAGGNLPLAAERAGIDKKELVTLICGGDTASLTENLKALLVLTLFDNIMQAGLVMKELMPHMPPHEIGKTYSSMLQAFTALTSAPTPDLNGEMRDATVVKERLVTRLQDWKDRAPKLVEGVKVEEVS